MFTSIFVPIDLDEPGAWRKAVPAALELAREHHSRLTFGTVIPDREAAREVPWSPSGYRELVEVARARLHRLVDGYDPPSYRALVGGGSVAGGILDLAREADADLIVLASHRPGVKDYVIGAHAAHVVRHASCSVLVVRE